MEATRQKRTGAEEGTRTPTPLRVHGPEPCASANSATSAKSVRGNLSLPFRKGLRVIFYRGSAGCQTAQPCRVATPRSMEAQSTMDDSQKLPPEMNRRLRTL